MKIMTFDPGNSTGWVYYDTIKKTLEGGTVVEDFESIVYLINGYKPDIVIYETFALYPGSAQSLAWNTFYPVEVIGVIKYICITNGIKCSSQAASTKKYSGGIDDAYERLKLHCGKVITGHTKDAYFHLRYFLRMMKGN